jgi:hypothetical protein
VCSISTSRIADELLAALERAGDRQMIERRLYNFAKEADLQTPAMLDKSQTHMRRMPQDLKNVRKITIGRHRIYYIGHHTQCSYKVFYIKKFKQSGKDDDDDKRFQKILAKAALEPRKRVIDLGDNDLCQNLI